MKLLYTVKSKVAAKPGEVQLTVRILAAFMR